MTNEPGCYFNEELLKLAYEKEDISKYFNKDLIKEYMEDVGGVRIEDDFVVTKDGYKNFTESLPKEVEEIEKILNK